MVDFKSYRENRRSRLKWGGLLNVRLHRQHVRKATDWNPSLSDLISENVAIRDVWSKSLPHQAVLSRIQSYPQDMRVGLVSRLNAPNRS